MKDKINRRKVIKEINKLKVELSDLNERVQEFWIVERMTCQHWQNVFLACITFFLQVIEKRAKITA